MSAPTDHWKLGLFVVVSVLLGLGVAAFVGAEALHVETVSYKSYLDEGVSGLAIGSPVTFRGVTLGNVSAIDVARDGRHVEITYDLGVVELGRLGLATKRGDTTRIKLPADLRVQLGSNGLTGSKYIQLDFFPLATNPLPRLPFPVAKNYIPATSSTMKDVEAAVLRAADAIPKLATEMTLVLTQASGLLEEVRAEELPARARIAFDAANHLLVAVDDQVRALELKELSNEARAALVKLDVIFVKAQGVLSQIEGQRGLVVSLTRASNRIGDLAENARDLGPDMSRSLVDVQEAARALQQLVMTLERDPDMLIKGRARASE